MLQAKRIQNTIDVATMVAESTRQALKPIPVEERLLLPLKALPPKPPKQPLPAPNKFFDMAAQHERPSAYPAAPAAAEPAQEREIPGMTYDRPKDKSDKRPPPASAAANFEKALAAANAQSKVPTKVPAKVPNAWSDLNRTAEIVFLAASAKTNRGFGHNNSPGLASNVSHHFFFHYVCVARGSHSGNYLRHQGIAGDLDLALSAQFGDVDSERPSKI